VPPRFAYWTILIDDKPTAFRAREREELQPTFTQLQRKNANVVMRWFARGKLWASREAERDDFQKERQAALAPRERRGDSPKPAERRGSDWRPGGTHKDPRDRFKKKNRPERAWSEKDPVTQRDRDKPGYRAGPPQGPRDNRPRPDPPRGIRPWSSKPPGFRPKKPDAGKPSTDRPAPQNDRPWQTKPTGPRAQRKPWVGKASDDRPWGKKPSGFLPHADRSWRNKPEGAPRGDKAPGDQQRPWSGKSRGGKPGGFGAGTAREGTPWSGRPKESSPPAAGSQKPWQKRPFRPNGTPRPDTRKRRDDEPPDRD
jgi:hypothetical protein